MIKWAVWGMCILLMFSGAVADTLVTTSGEKLTGRIVAEDANTVTIDIGQAGISLRKSFPRSDVESIAKDVIPDGPRYFEIPVMGVVGQDIKADTLAEALAAARSARATYVVLLIDSPGGMISEMEKIIQVMQENKDLQTIAFVRNAHSAAAVIAGTCKTIIMHPMGQIGAALPYMMEANGRVKDLPRDVNEKLNSAVRALIRTAASVGGHPPELFMGMIDPDIQLYFSEEAGGVRISEEENDKATCIKRQGKILTMNADEAIKYRLASTTCKSMREVGAHLGLAQWSSAGNAGWDIVRQHSNSTAANPQQARVREIQREATRKLGDDALGLLKLEERRIQSEMESIQQQLDALEKRYQSNSSRFGDSSVFRRDYENQRKTLESYLEVWQKRLDQCRQQIAYVKRNMQ